MKKFRLFFAIVLLATLTLSSCTNDEKAKAPENKEVLNEVNTEVDNTVKEDEKTESTWAEASEVKETEASTSTTETKIVQTWKVQKINKIYKSPGWDDEVSFSVEMDWDKIKSVLVTTIKWGDDSTKLMKLFGDSINKEVSWKTIAEVSDISAVWWASLTTIAFKEALKDVK